MLRAIAYGFRVVFQPIFYLHTLRVYGYEALARPPEWAGSPGEFFARAVASSCAAAVDERVCRLAVQEFARAGRQEALFLNLTLPSFLRRNGLVRALAGVPPSRVVLEVTEHAFATAPGEMASSAKRWKELGYRVAVDDVGSGQSRVLALAEVGGDFVKVDRPLVTGALAGGRAERVLEHLVRMAASLGAEVVAEGIETEEELKFVRNLGIRFGQGYLLGRPEPLGKVA
jgi:EAL domain-containing protein (putative c-di-GMP-specific phosphodiesterase class I)